MLNWLKIEGDSEILLEKIENRWSQIKYLAHEVAKSYIVEGTQYSIY